LPRRRTVVQVDAHADARCGASERSGGSVAAGPMLLWLVDRADPQDRRAPGWRNSGLALRQMQAGPGRGHVAVGFRTKGTIELPRAPKSCENPGCWGENTPKTGLISLRIGENRLYSAPSHTETWLKRPSGGNRADWLVLLTRFRRNQPENYIHGATRILDASAA
jgi:hypothetical protein